jgi:hypothetical protein
VDFFVLNSNFLASFDKAPTLYRKGIYKEVPTLARKPRDCSVVFTHEKIVKQRTVQKEVSKKKTRIASSVQHFYANKIKYIK